MLIFNAIISTTENGAIVSQVNIPIKAVSRNSAWEKALFIAFPDLLSLKNKMLVLFEDEGVF
ncbi:MAG: hypothetical protein Q9M43_05845 [Sulfurimonas sp.]|nr:hypothetical protein [Sulfurimonas sp.]